MRAGWAFARAGRQDTYWQVFRAYPPLWAKHGVARVAHVLNQANTRVLKFGELCTRYPSLVGRGATRDCVKRMFERISSNLHKWQYTLSW